jgi:SAM-dependent methyltransferase
MNTTTQTFFDRLYSNSPDPWGFASNAYEQGRYRHIIELLGDESFERGFEPGCSIGELTRLLASRCRHLLATDISPRAVAQARSRCAGLQHVEIVHARLPEDLPPAGLDLLIFSEIGYYFSRVRLTLLLDRLAERMLGGALLVAAHWTGESADHVLPGSEVHALISAHHEFECRHHEQRPGYVIGVWRRR